MWAYFSRQCERKRGETQTDNFAIVASHNNLVPHGKIIDTHPPESCLRGCFFRSVMRERNTFFDTSPHASQRAQVEFHKVFLLQIGGRRDSAKAQRRCVSHRGRRRDDCDGNATQSLLPRRTACKAAVNSGLVLRKLVFLVNYPALPCYHSARAPAVERDDPTLSTRSPHTRE